MPPRESAPVGAPWCWVDLLTSDVEQARSFYDRLFGWTSEAAGAEYGGYVNFLKDGAPGAGCMVNDGQAGMPDVGRCTWPPRTPRRRPMPRWPTALRCCCRRCG